MLRSQSLLYLIPCKTKTWDFHLILGNKYLNQERCIKYLAVFIDSDWVHIKKNKRTIGVLSKIRYYVDIAIVSSLYYPLVYPFLIDGIIAWGKTYSTTLQPLFILQKKYIFDEHTSPLFKKLHDLVSYLILQCLRIDLKIVCYLLFFILSFLEWVIFINITQDLQQNSHITSLELEPIMVNPALEFKDLRFGI